MNRLALVLTLAWLPRPAGACLWDYDTLLQERSRFPGALELIAGKVIRHSLEFYRWRVEDRLARLAKSPDDPGLLDDLGVAFEKLGESGQAIETARRSLERAPGRYETLANLGTFLAHAGRLDEAAVFLRQALDVNPDAHFGRELYQLYLIEYAMRPGSVMEELGLPDHPEHGAGGRAPRTGPVHLPLETESRIGGRVGFAAYVRQRLESESRQKPTTGPLEGLLGMMRFGRGESPILLEALGDVLLAGKREGAKRMAARAYLKASYGTDDDGVREAYRKLASGALSMQTQGPGTHRAVSLRDIESELEDELEEARDFVEAIRLDETQWIAQGEDVERAFEAKYHAQPALSVNLLSELRSRIAGREWILGLVILLVAVRVVQQRRSNRNRPAK